ncbi:MAG: alpha-1,2-fucosyltransferase [Patescibacteria group bacterium]|nr:alpha-1,2-fucosyltransferase [bacterium]MDZ4240721.1 alpha-1,2-fucosyltransferase [Patescibacteria group bacterium]
MNKDRKPIIILQHGGGELGNQLWNFVSIYAYCLEKGYDCRNYSFFEYGKFFNIPVSSPLIDTFFFSPFASYTKRRNAMRVKIWRFLYKILFIMPVRLFFGKNIISSKNIEKKVYYLPPTETSKELENAERRARMLYMDGWLFRNPVGMKKYRKEIITYFAPQKDISASIEKTLGDLRGKYNYLVGVHIRQGDYTTYKGGEYLIPQKRVREILDEYLHINDKDSASTCFVITTDGKVDEEIFKGLHIVVNNKSAVEDMFTLSGCDVIIGSDSSFGNFAAYYGDIPHIVFKKEPMDWEYYKGKSDYFENKYCTLVHY